MSGSPDTLAVRLPARITRAMPKTVLLVDDDAEFRGLAAMMLAAMGLQVVGEAGTLASGTAAAAELRPDAAIVDVELPDGNGVALAAQLAALPWRPRVVVTSSDPEVTSAAAVQSFGAVGFVAKAALPDGALAAMLTGE
jgi:DNA-binding NarL/FixJ family response regulator